MSEDKDLFDSQKDVLMDSCGVGVERPKAWARLRFDLRLLTPEQVNKIWEAGRLLHEAGVSFDAGTGRGRRDWELDWSLEGADLDVRPLACQAKGCQRDRKKGFKLAYWTDLHRLGVRDYTYSRVYCSSGCQNTGEQLETRHEVQCNSQAPTVHADHSGHSVVYEGPAAEVLLHETAEAWEVG